MAKKKVVPKGQKLGRKAPRRIGLKVVGKFGWPGEIQVGRIRGVTESVGSSQKK